MLGIPILLVSWLLDCYTFLVNIYRDDIISYEDAANHDYVMNEEQFAELEAFCKQEMRMMVMASYNKVATKEEPADTVPIKNLINNLRDRLKVFAEINNLLF